MPHKIKVMHVRLNGVSDQVSIRQFEDLCGQFVTAHPGATQLLMQVTPVFGSSAQTLTAIYSYHDPAGATQL